MFILIYYVLYFLMEITLKISNDFDRFLQFIDI